MDFWQYNAWQEAWEQRNADDNSKLAQAAYLAAYWMNSGKKGKPLSTVLKALQPKDNKPREKINKDEVAAKFRQFEELKNNGWTQVDSN